MYIKKVEITNIRSIDHFEMTFDNPAGWHVLIGDNGSGKSTILRSIALALIGSEQAAALRTNWKDWLRKGEENGAVSLDLISDPYFDHYAFEGGFMGVRFDPEPINLNNSVNLSYKNKDEDPNAVKLESNIILPTLPGWFSSAFGPFRRFTGGADEWNEVFRNSQLKKLSAHLTLFNESVALTETVGWVMKQQFQKLEQKNNYLDGIKELINSIDFLPGDTKLNDISSDGVTFIDGEGSIISVNQLSDGFRSILSLTFELLRLITDSYAGLNVFKKTQDGTIFISVPGIVLIDEIDSHLHPTWQTRIGQWFTKYFPNIQFIVTTHSPLVCRACEKGSIWRLSAPGSEVESGQVTGTDRQRLIYGNVLDAYGTDVFGEDVSQSANAGEMLKELGDLNLKSFKGIISEEEKKRMRELKTILPTE